MNRRAWLFALLFVGALLSGWAWWAQHDRSQPQTTVVKRPDYVLQDVEMTVLDKEGKEAFTMIAPKIERDPDAKTMQIATPLFQIPPKAGSQASAWELRSQTGWVSPKGEEVRLRGQVHADSTNGDGKPVKVATDELNIFPDDKRATSASTVTVTQPGLILNGRGLEADLDAKRIQLKSDVKARYERIAR